MPKRIISYILFLLITGHYLSAQYTMQDGVRTLVPADILLKYQRTASENCQNGIDDDGDGFIDCADEDCQVLINGGFEDVPTNNIPGSYITFPPYPNFQGSWAAVNIDGEVYYESDNRPAFEGHRYASLLQNAGANPRQPWNETSWQSGGYDRFLFIENTFTLSEYNMTFYHGADNRYGYYGDSTLIQIQSLDTDYYFDTLIATPGYFDWQPVNLSFVTDAETNSVAILFSTLSPWNSSVLIDGLKFCGARVLEVEAIDDSITLSTNTSIDIEVLANDINLPDEALTINIPTDGWPSNGSVLINPDGTITYTPNTGFSGTDLFHYTICNTGISPNQCSTAEVRIEVVDIFVPVTDTFLIVMDEDDFAQVCDSYFEIYGAITEVNICNDGAFGHCEENVFPCVDYIPHADYFGMDTICIIICDAVVCDTSIFIIEIRPVNDNPIANDDLAITTEDLTVVFDILGNDHDIDNDLELSGVTILDQPNHGILVLGPGNEVTYVPDEGFHGQDTLIYLICDNGVPSLCDWAEVILEVHPISDTAWIVINEDSNIFICADSSFEQTEQATGPTAIFLNEHGTMDAWDETCLDYHPQEDYSGMDTVWIVTCTASLCDTAVHVIQILPVNDPPVAVDDISQTDVGNSVLIDVVINDSDEHDGGDVDPYTVSVVDQAQYGEAVLQGDGTILYIPDLGFSGADQFTYLVCDLGTPLPALCDTATVVVMVGDGENIKCMIPESFSPNGDGLYDHFEIECAEYFPELELSIYDRFGNQMYQSKTGYVNDWDGTSMNNNKPLRDGTYYWIVRFNNGYTKDRAGFVLIWR